MRGPADVRYETLDLLSREGERQAWAARDRWTGALVILKSDHLDLARHELAILLSLPPGIAPRVLDVVWKGGGQLWFALERLEGQTLGAAAAGLSPDAMPWIGRALAQCLGHLHRTGMVHGDISPENLFLLDAPGEPAVRCLDFGRARSRDFEADMHAGGTPPFIAPEITRGWIVDGRADQYSLGVILRELFPQLARDSRWSPILERLCRRIPGQRYPHMLALRDDLEATFRLPPSGFRWPPFGGGPLRGRAELLTDITNLVTNGRLVRILLFTRRGLGLSRFLWEVTLEAAAGDGPPLRILDVGSLRAEGREGQELVGHLERCIQDAGSLLIALPSLSRRLRGFPPDLARDLLRVIRSQPGWEERSLPPLDAPAFAEIVAGSMESGGDLTESLASRLLTASDGDLRCSAELFRELVQHDGRETGLSWVVELDRVHWRSQRGSPPTPYLNLTELAPGEREALRILARAGRSFPRRLAQDLLDRFHPSGSLPELLDSALLIAEDTDRLAFVTRALWEEALAWGGAGLPPGPAGREGVVTPPDADLVDRWLNDHAFPDPDRLEAVLFAARRARRLGDRQREGAWIGEALLRAEKRRVWGHVQDLLAYPDEPPLRWSREEVQRQAAALAELLAPAWTAERLTFLASNALVFREPGAALALQAQAAESSDIGTCAAAHGSLAERALRGHDDAGYEQHLAELERLAQLRGGPSPGVLEYLRGSAARVRGDTAKAEEHLTGAIALLRGTGHPYEQQGLQLLAVLRFAHDPPAGIALLEAALAEDPGPESEAQLRANLSIMYSQVHDDEAAARCIEEGLRRLQGRISRARVSNLRMQRAWAWAESDRVDKALREALGLIQTPSVRASQLMRLGARMLIGFCHLHLGNANAAISESALAWRDILEGRFVYAVSDCLQQLLDVLLDFEAWEVVREFGTELLLEPEMPIRLEPTAAARLRAFRAQLEGDPAAAREHLAAGLEEGRRAADAHTAARYLHHAGLLHLAARDGAAAALFQEELARLGQHGRSYYRGRALLCLARARATQGEMGGAHAALEEAIALASRAGCKGLLVDALETRLQFRMEGAASQTAGTATLNGGAR